MTDIEIETESDVDDLDELDININIEEIFALQNIKMIKNIIYNSNNSLKYLLGFIQEKNIKNDCLPLILERKKKLIFISRNEKMQELDFQLWARFLQYCTYSFSLTYITLYEMRLKRTNELFNVWLNLLTYRSPHYPLPYAIPEIRWNESSTSKICLFVADYEAATIFDRKKMYFCVLDFLKKGVIVETFNYKYILSNSKNKLLFIDASSLYVMTPEQLLDIQSLLHFCQKKKNNKNIFYHLHTLELSNKIDSTLLKILVEYLILFLQTRDRLLTVDQYSRLHPEEILLESLLFSVPHVYRLYHSLRSYFLFALVHCKDLETNNLKESSSLTNDHRKTVVHSVKDIDHSDTVDPSRV